MEIKEKIIFLVVFIVLLLGLVYLVNVTLLNNELSNSTDQVNKNNTIITEINDTEINDTEINKTKINDTEINITYKSNYSNNDTETE